MSKDKFIPQSKEIAKDTKMPVYEYQRGMPSTIVTIHEDKRPSKETPPPNHLLQNLKI